MAIKFILHTAFRDTKVKHFTIEKGDEILKIIFDEKDVHISNKGKLHLDIWGSKLRELKRRMR